MSNIESREKLEIIRKIELLKSKLALSNEELESVTGRLSTSESKLSATESKLSTSESKLSATESKLSTIESKMEKLLSELLFLRRQLFGHKTERYIPSDPNQLKLDFEGLDILPEEEQDYDEAVIEVASYVRIPKKEKKIPTRQPIPEHLRRVDETIQPEGVDIKELVWMKDEITELLEYTPGEIYVRRIIRPQYVSKSDEKIYIGNLPSLPLPKSNAGASLLAQLLVSKYVDHLPFHRQIAIFKRDNVPIAASTVNDWFFASTSLLVPLYEKLREITLQSDYIGVDESTIPVVDREKSKSIKAYMWVVRDNNKNLAFFHYDKGSRSQKTLVNLLNGYKGTIQSDGYGAYSLYENKEDVLLLACMAHCRRKFEESLTNDHDRASKALEQIGMLYTVERMADDKNMSFQERTAHRKRLAYPILIAFEKWLEANLMQVLPKSKIGGAIYYAHTIFRRLSRYILDGRYRLDNNLVENIIRPLALGRKQYLFCQTHEAAYRAAIVYSLMACCKLHDVNPIAWLTDIFSRIDERGIKIENLLPHNWSKPEGNPAQERTKAPKV